MAPGPLGKYQNMVAALLATLIIVTALAVRVASVFTGTAITGTTFLDNLALIAIGAVFGAGAATSVNGDAIAAAHRRLDQISAPPAQYLEDQAKPPPYGPGK